MTAKTLSVSIIDQGVEHARAIYLARCAPAHLFRQLLWSGGETQLIELGQGPPLLLLHGGGGHAAQWGPLLYALSQHHHILAIDRPGHGLADAFDYTRVDLLSHAHRFISDVLDAEGLQSA